jgi:hypothetical protein
MNRLSLTLITLVTLFASACAHVHFENVGSEKNGERKVTKKLHSFVFGLVKGRSKATAEELCGPDRLAKAEAKLSASDLALAAITLGIYVPHRIDAECAAGARSSPSTAPPGP